MEEEHTDTPLPAQPQSSKKMEMDSPSCASRFTGHCISRPRDTGLLRQTSHGRSHRGLVIEPRDNGASVEERCERYQKLHQQFQTDIEDFLKQSMEISTYMNKKLSLIEMASLLHEGITFRFCPASSKEPGKQSSCTLTLGNEGGKTIHLNSIANAFNTYIGLCAVQNTLSAADAQRNNLPRCRWVKN